MEKIEASGTSRAVPVAAGGAAHLLVAGDDPSDMLVLAGLLEDLGYTHESASNGFEALALLRRRPFAAALLTCQMSEMDGFQATRAIRAGAGGNRRLPVVAMTPDVENERATCLAVGMDDLLAKPVNGQSLRSILERWVPVDGIDAPPPLRPAVARGDVLDRSRLDELHAMTTDGSSLRDRIIFLFLKSAPEALTRLRAAVAAGSDPGLVRAAHWLKGSALTVGAPRVAAACERLELPEPVRDWEAARADVGLLSRELDWAMSALRSIQV